MNSRLNYSDIKIDSSPGEVHEIKGNVGKDLAFNNTLASVAYQNVFISTNNVVKKVEEAFESDDNLMGVMITDEDEGNLLGMISRKRFMELYSKPFRKELYSKKSLKLMVAEDFDAPLCLNETENIQQAVLKALSRPQDQMYEPIVVKTVEHGYKLIDTQVLLLDLLRVHESQSRELKEKNDNIMESISYAERLQRAILPPLPHRLGISDDKCFVIWKPKDVVGGDMYWCRSDERYALIAVADCTGHGVPGALMTMALGSILDGLPRVLDGQKPSMLLYSIHNSLKETLRQEHADSLADDGADVALCMLDKKDKIFLFAGAKLSLFLEKDGIITEYKGSRHSVGYSQRKDVFFEDRLIDWVDGSVAYLTTDGLLHQHCEEGKGGLGRTGFVNLLQRIAGSPFAEQEKAVEQFIAERVKHVEQRDDITVVSFEIGKSLEGRIGI